VTARRRKAKIRKRKMRNSRKLSTKWLMTTNRRKISARKRSRRNLKARKADLARNRNHRRRLRIKRLLIRFRRRIKKWWRKSRKKLRGYKGRNHQSKKLKMHFWLFNRIKKKEKKGRKSGTTSTICCFQRDEQLNFVDSGH